MSLKKKKNYFFLMLGFIQIKLQFNVIIYIWLKKFSLHCQSLVKLLFDEFLLIYSERLSQYFFI